MSARMVKVNESKGEEMHGHGPMSSLSSDGSFVVLERSPTQEPSGQFSSHAGHFGGFPPIPAHNSFIGGSGRLESQISHNSAVSNSLSSDMSPEEIQRKLQELLQENMELRETLHQNNLAMKQQFATLVKWQEEVCKVHQTHKTKFNETKELVLKLRAENTELKRILEEYRQAGSSVPSASETDLKLENVELKGKIAELQQKLSTPVPRTDHGGLPSKKELELNSVLEKVNRQLETAEHSRRQLTVDVERLTAQRTRLERDLTAQKTEMEEQREQLQILRRENDVMTYKLSAISKQHGIDITFGNEQPAGGHMSQLAHQVEEQKTLINSLTYQLQQEKNKVAAQGVAIPSAQEKSKLVHDMKDYERTLEHLSGCMSQEAVRFSSLDSWLQVASDNMSQWKGKQAVDMNMVSTLRAEIQELRVLLSQEQAYSQEKKLSLDEAQRKFHNLYIDYQTVVKELESINKEKADTSTYQEVQARGFTEKIDRMTAQLMNKEEALEQKTKDLIQLREKVKKLELENEAITILKAQVEVYQSDFNAEREARENLAGEKERLAEDLRHLQRRNQQLLDELEAYQRNQFEQIQRQAPQSQNSNDSGWNTLAAPGRRSPPRTSPGRLSAGRPSPGPRQETPSPQPAVEQADRPPFRHETSRPVYYCPKCERGFTDIHNLERHVDQCLEL